jgi:hypothetical protein
VESDQPVDPYSQQVRVSRFRASRRRGELCFPTPAGLSPVYLLFSLLSLINSVFLGGDGQNPEFFFILSSGLRRLVWEFIDEIAS